MSASDGPTARLSPTAHVGGVRLQVTDLPRSLAYYREGLGLSLIDSNGTMAMLGAARSTSPLVVLQAMPGTRPPRRRGGYGLFHFAILVPSRQALGRFLTHLSDIGVYAGMSDHGVSEALYLSDPDGLGIEVYADRPRSSWQYAGGQLVMGTDPLDAQDLARAGGGVPWDGMPAGTTIGHMHLHVGDLGRAAEFYRDRLGFDITVATYPGALFFSAGGYHHHLGTNTWAPGPAAAPDEARLLEWTLVVASTDEVGAVAERARLDGAAVRAEGDDRLVDDPWGTTLRIAPQRPAA
jgi:catechol 2,3-dioxygenase